MSRDSRVPRISDVPNCCYKSPELAELAAQTFDVRVNDSRIGRPRDGKLHQIGTAHRPGRSREE
jgi:hypothetical protein